VGLNEVIRGRNQNMQDLARVTARLSDVHLVLLAELASESKDVAVNTVRVQLFERLKAFRQHPTEPGWARCVKEARILHQAIAEAAEAENRPMSEVERWGESAVRAKRAAQRYEPPRPAKLRRS